MMMMMNLVRVLTSSHVYVHCELRFWDKDSSHRTRISDDQFNADRFVPICQAARPVEESYTCGVGPYLYVYLKVYILIYVSFKWLTGLYNVANLVTKLQRARCYFLCCCSWLCLTSTHSGLPVQLRHSASCTGRLNISFLFVHWVWFLKAGYMLLGA